MPEKIEWQADDADFKGMKEAKTMMLSLWDKKEKLHWELIFGQMICLLMI